MTNDMLHIVFSRDDKHSLRRALEEHGREDPIATFNDDLSYGEIGQPAFTPRMRWLDSTFNFTEWMENYRSDGPSFWVRHLVNAPWRADRDAETAFWHMALAPYPQVVLWLTRRSARHLAGAMEWLRRAESRACNIVDLTDAVVPANPYRNKAERHVHGIADLAPDWPDILRRLQTAGPISDALRAEWNARWKALQAENAPLRVIGDAGLRSAPLTHFDLDLLARCKYREQKVAKIVAMTMEDLEEADKRPPNGLVLAGRLNALVDSGRLEMFGEDCLTVDRCEVRLTWPEGVEPPSSAC